MRRKTIVFAAKLMLATAIISAFLLISSMSVFPLGTYINVHVACYQDGSAISGLPVTVTYVPPSAVGGWSYTQTLSTGVNGVAGPFGSGLIAGAYQISYMWNGTQSSSVIVNGTKEYWTFNFTVPNPEIIKHFVYSVNSKVKPPVVGLTVELFNATSGKELTSAVTDSTGTVIFNVDVGQNYYMAYSWEGAAYREPLGTSVITFNLPITNESCLVWQATNNLEPISGEDTI